MNCKVKFILIQTDGLLMNIRATPKIIRNISECNNSVLYGYYDNTVKVKSTPNGIEKHIFMIDKQELIFIYGCKYNEKTNCKLNVFSLPEPSLTTLPKIYGDVFLFKYNMNRYNYEDFTKDMWQIISIKK